MKKFEYDTITMKATGFWLGGNIDNQELNQILNEKGTEGWELVSCFTTAQGSGNTKYIVAVMKRELNS